jgi:transaldolase/glucose-6-phosphate isomerase
VPGHSYTFSTVKEAQARSDFDALAKRGRRALRIDLGEDPTVGLSALRDSIERVLDETTGNRAKTRR